MAPFSRLAFACSSTFIFGRTWAEDVCSADGTCDESSSLIQLRRHAESSQMTPVMCPGSTSDQCHGNMCCPGNTRSRGKTFPCPSADKTYVSCDMMESPSLMGSIRGAVPDDCEGCIQKHSTPGSPLPDLPMAPNPDAADNGAIKISLFGQEETKYFYGAKIFDEGKGFVLTEQPFEKVYLMNSPMTTSSDKRDFQMVQLAGNFFEVTVNMGPGGASCGCNVAFFLVSMPSPASGQYNDYYCDANCVGGNCCAEFDLMEMNVHTLQTTSHRCYDYQPPPFQSSPGACDHSGSPEIKFGNGNNNFGPGGGFTIDSEKTFKYRMEFPYENGKLFGYVYLEQDGKTVVEAMGDLAQMEAPLRDGMVLLADAWYATDMRWLDGGACSTPETCNMGSTTFTNMVIDKLPDTPTPVPSPVPSPAPSPVPTPPSGCPDQGYCNCGWANSETCGSDDGSECWCRCCCQMAGGSCRWGGQASV